MRYASITQRLSGLGSDKWEVHIRARQMARAGMPVLLLTIGEPDLPPPRELLDVAAKAMHAGRTRYSSGRGEAPVLAALAAKYSARTGREISASQFVYVPGTQTALYAVMMAVAQAGNEVLVGDPLYATYEGVIRATGATQIPVPLRREHGFHLQARDVEAAITPRTRALLLNSPHNPTGAVLTRDEIRAIGAVARAHDLWIISDEVYESLVFRGPFASPFDEADLAERTIVVSSISKSHGATGFRAGWCAGSPEFINALLPLAETMLFGGQPFIADMAAEALSRDFDITARMRDAYRGRAAQLATVLGQVPGLSVVPPEAGMFAMLDVSGLGLSGKAFAVRLLEEEKVAVMPGDSFGEAAIGMVRVSLTVPDAVLAEGCQRIAALARRLAETQVPA